MEGIWWESPESLTQPHNSEDDEGEDEVEMTHSMLYSLAKEGKEEISIWPKRREEEEEEEDWEEEEEEEWEAAREWKMGTTNPVFSHQGAWNITTQETELPNTREAKEEGSRVVISEGVYRGGGWIVTKETVGKGLKVRREGWGFNDKTETHHSIPKGVDWVDVPI